jgi:hypothetical protein
MSTARKQRNRGLDPLHSAPKGEPLTEADRAALEEYKRRLAAGEKNVGLDDAERQFEQDLRRSAR